MGATSSNKVFLFSAAAAAGNGVKKDVLVGGSYVLAASGTFGGTVLKLQLLGPDGTTWIDIPGATLSAAGALAVDLSAASEVRGVLTGGTPSAFYATLEAIN